MNVNLEHSYLSFRTLICLLFTNSRNYKKYLHFVGIKPVIFDSNIPVDDIGLGCSRRTCIRICSHSERGLVPSAVVRIDRSSQNSPLPLYVNSVPSILRK